MPDLSRAQSIPIGQFGKFQQVAPRAEDQGIGGVLQKAAATQFGAAAQEVETGSRMAQLGASQSAMAEELLKPFKKLKDSRQVLEAEDMANTAKLQLQAEYGAMTSGGAPAERWLETYEQSYKRVATDAFTKAKAKGSATWEHVYKEVQAEDFRIRQDILKGMTKSNLEDQQGMLYRNQDFMLKEAIKTSDSATRTGLLNKANAQIDTAVFNGIITPEVGDKKKEWFHKELTVNVGVQTALTVGLTAGIDSINKSALLPDDKREAVNKMINAVQLRTQEAERMEKAAEKQHKLDQDTAYTQFKAAVVVEGDPTKLISMLANIQSDMRIFGPVHGAQLVSDIKSRLDELQKPIPMEDNEEVRESFRAAIVMNPDSVTEAMINSAVGLKSTTKQDLSSLRRQRLDDSHHSKLTNYKRHIDMFKAIEPTITDKFASILAKSPVKDYGEAIAKAAVVYDRMLMDMRQKKGAPLTETDIATLDQTVEKMIADIKKTKYSDTPGESLQTFGR